MKHAPPPGCPSPEVTVYEISARSRVLTSLGKLLWGDATSVALFVTPSSTHLIVLNASPAMTAQNCVQQSPLEALRPRGCTP